MNNNNLPYAYANLASYEGYLIDKNINNITCYTYFTPYKKHLISFSVFHLLTNLDYMLVSIDDNIIMKVGLEPFGADLEVCVEIVQNIEDYKIQYYPAFKINVALNQYLNEGFLQKLTERCKACGINIEDQPDFYSNLLNYLYKLIIKAHQEAQTKQFKNISYLVYSKTIDSLNTKINKESFSNESFYLPIYENSNNNEPTNTTISNTVGIVLLRLINTFVNNRIIKTPSPSSTPTTQPQIIALNKMFDIIHKKYVVGVLVKEKNDKYTFKMFELADLMNQDDKGLTIKQKKSNLYPYTQTLAINEDLHPEFTLNYPLNILQPYLDLLTNNETSYSLKSKIAVSLIDFYNELYNLKQVLLLNDETLLQSWNQKSFFDLNGNILSMLDLMLKYHSYFDLSNLKIKNIIKTKTNVNKTRLG